MVKLFKYLKKYSGFILLIFGLLIVQAYCDLALPGYTSDIVNVGIQQSGVETSVPEVIRESQLEKISVFLTEEEKAVLEGLYTAVESEKDLPGKYKLTDGVTVGDEQLYVLKEEVSDEIAQMLALPILLTYSFDGNSDYTQSAQEEMLAEIPEDVLEMLRQEDGSIDMFMLFSMMPEEQVAEIFAGIREQLAEMPDMLLEQSGIAYTTAEYQSIGINVRSVQNRYIITTGAKMLALALLAAIIAILVAYLASQIAARMARELRSNVFHKVIAFSSAEYNQFSTASLITRSTNDIQQVQMLVVIMLRMVLYAPVMAIGGVLKVLGTNSGMTWILGVGVGVLFLLIIIMFTGVMPKFKKLQKMVDKINLIAREILTGLPVIRAFSTEEHERKRFGGANKDLMKVNLFVTRAMSAMMPLMMLIMNLLTVLIVWVGANYIDLGTMQVGDMLAFIQYAMMIIMSFLMLSMVSIFLPRASVSMGRIDEVLTTEISIQDMAQTKSFDQSEKGLVEFDNVSFRYPGADEDVLSNISFTAKPGETTAIIGSTGSGKSTLVNLIPRFFDITDGSIRVSGRDIREVPSYDLRESIGYVPQKGVLFSGTIETNIKYSNLDLNDEQMKRAARIAQAENFIEEKEDKYDSDISQGGTNVSGGQRQRLSIARAIAKDPDIYIFDDSFSALDYRTDVALRSALKQEIADSTVIIVAQRISTIIHAEQIIVLDEGQVVGKGTHAQLLENCDVYRQIASSQLSEEELEIKKNQDMTTVKEGI